MGKFIVILISIAGLALSGYFLRKNLLIIKARNQEVQSKAKRAYNYAWTGIWYFYLITFFIGLTVNNLITD